MIKKGLPMRITSALIANPQNLCMRTPTLVVRHPRWTWYPVAFLLILCLVHGLWATRGLRAPAIVDTFRDAGFVQGIVDGNWWGDPAIDGAMRYYPPLVHALFAAVASVTGLPPLHLLINAAPWVNLIVPLGFFLMGRNLIGAPAAVFGVAMIVMFNGLVLPPWISAGYHPWSSVPLLALGGFFLAVWLIQVRGRTASMLDAILIGTAVGLVFLAHTVPALILAAIVPTVACSRGVNARIIAWVVVVGLVTIAWSVPLMLPLLFSYHMHVLNAIPGHYVDPLFAVWPSRAMLLTLVPGVVAIPMIYLLRAEVTLRRESYGIIAVWIMVPSLFLARHYACDPVSNAAVCTVFVLTVHHWFIYLQAAFTCLAALAAWLCTKRAMEVIRRPQAWAAAGCLAAAACTVAVVWLRPSDGYMRQRALALADFFDWDAYGWVAEHAAPKDLFVTELLEETLNSASVAVMAAGRPSVAIAATFSNPYVDWETRNRRSLRYLAAARASTEHSNSALCDLLNEAGDGSHAYMILPSTQRVVAAELRADLIGKINTIYRVMPEDCAAGT